MKMSHSLLGVLTIMAAFSGCTTEPAKLKSETEPYIKQGRIQFEDVTTKYLLEIVRVDTPDRTTINGLLKVIVTIRNLTEDDLWAEIQTTFLDEKGHVLELTNWEPIQLTARTVTEYSSTSIGPRAADYRVIIRKPAKSTRKRP